MIHFIRQIRDVLSPKARRRVWMLLAMMVVGTLLESLSIGIVVPILGVLAEPTWIDRHPRLQHAVNIIGAVTPQRLAVWAMSALVVMYVVKTGFAATLAYLEARFAYGTQADLSSRLFAGYLRQPWTFHLQRNSAELIRNTTTESSAFASLLLSSLHFLSETLIAIALAVLLVLAEPVGAMVALATMAGAASLFQAFTRSRVTRWGQYRLSYEASRLKQLQQGLGGAKEVKLLGRELHFERLFDTHNRALARTQQRQQFVGQLPRLWLETVGIVGIATLVITLVIRDDSFAAALPSLGLFAAAAFRLLPALNRIVSALQTIRFRLPSVQVVHSELETIKIHRTEASTSSPRLTVRRISLNGVYYRYPASPDDVLRGVSLTIDSGTTVGFIGPSGAGKSTLVDLLLGLLQPTAGRVCVNGVDIRSQLHAWQSTVGYVPQAIYLTDDTIRRNVAFGLPDSEISDDDAWKALRDASLDDFVRALPQGLDTLTGERGVRLSGGQRQRIGIARALYHNPAVLVLDEATSALDGATETEVMQAVSALHGSKTIIIITHRVTTLDRCDVLYAVEKGIVSVRENRLRT